LTNHQTVLVRVAVIDAIMTALKNSITIFSAASIQPIPVFCFDYMNDITVLAASNWEGSC
jgi:hypothetical protein